MYLLQTLLTFNHISSAIQLSQHLVMCIYIRYKPIGSTDEQAEKFSIVLLECNQHPERELLGLWL